jgi:hypothetical protein
MAGQPLLNGLPLEEAKRLEARGGSGMRGDPFAKLRQPRLRVGSEQTRKFAQMPVALGDLTHSGTRTQTQAPTESVAKPKTVTMPIKTQGSIWKRKAEMASVQPQPGMGLLLSYRDFVRGILAKFSLGFDHLSLIMLVLILGLTVWLPLKIISSVFVALLTLIFPTAATVISATVGMLTSTIIFVACGYFIIDRLKSGKQK